MIWKKKLMQFAEVSTILDAGSNFYVLLSSLQYYS